MYIFIWSVSPRDAEKSNYIYFTSHLLEIARDCEINDFDKFMEKRRPKNATESRINKNIRSIEKHTT